MRREVVIAGSVAIFLVWLFFRSLIKAGLMRTEHKWMFLLKYNDYKEDKK